jgi:radical SAM superfamily enzyme YgiQ (UPF0313 family)
MNKRKKVLITTLPGSDIAKQARIKGWPVTSRSAQECYEAANNIEYINGFTCPNYATQFIKANIPSADILEYPTWDEYEEALKNKYDIVGISFWTYTSAKAVKMANMARRYGVKEVWGGGHGVSTPGIGTHFDRVFTGYAEYQMKPLVDGEPITSFKHPIMECEYDFYFEKVKTGYLFSIRGCQMSCEFCSGPRYYKHVSVTPIEEIERVLDVYLEKDIKHISIVDELFLQKKSHARKVLDAIHRRGMTFSATSRADVFSSHIKELREKGLRSVYIGIESLNDLSLHSVKKGIHSNHIIRLFKELVANGCFAFGTYMIGFEHDTVENVKENIEKLNVIEGLFAVEFWLVTPFPGTVFYENLDRKGKITSKNWEDYDAVHQIWRHPHMSNEEIEDLLRYAVKHHCNPINIRKIKLLRKWDKFEQLELDKNRRMNHEIRIN